MNARTAFWGRKLEPRTYWLIAVMWAVLAVWSLINGWVWSGVGYGVVAALWATPAVRRHCTRTAENDTSDQRTYL
ncbi:hypothetical protein [Rhodococcus sp. RDE2]|uniref:hypothetical protein n=1 Tax=Rhodococcus sp. RDE2 TaxID=2885078 RepID=UPI001E2987F0|nr:hypothetical protein [Rhodococcus sp. RDE2]BDB63525.1 hypothetical protein RDE2_53190 [Rhodococcus sp. RDE2]